MWTEKRKKTIRGGQKTSADAEGAEGGGRGCPPLHGKGTKRGRRKKETRKGELNKQALATRKGRAMFNMRGKKKKWRRMVGRDFEIQKLLGKRGQTKTREAPLQRGGGENFNWE